MASNLILSIYFFYLVDNLVIKHEKKKKGLLKKSRPELLKI
jgi:hypothetical protein